MNAEIISIGTELLLGHTLNRDAAILGRALADLGIDVLNIQTVGDNRARLRQALELAASRAQLIITTGGLGPTDDDLTKQTIAEFAGLPLEENAQAIADLREYFGSRPIGANQFRQALLPKGAVMFANSVGTAPGCAVELPNGSCLVMLPGPPGELERMWIEQALPYLAKYSDSVIYTTILRTFGIGEGEAGHRIGDLMAGANPTVAPYAHGGEMFVKITAKAKSREEARALCEPLVREVSSRLGDVIYGRDVESLGEAAVKKLIESGTSIATAESCTGGLLSAAITDWPGASKIFPLGLVCYANAAKESMLQVDPQILNAHGAVSPEVAKEMARNVRRLAGTDLGIGITGIAGPDGGTAQKPVGLVYIALAYAEDTVTREMTPQGRYLGRDFTRRRAVGHALDMVRRYLAKLPLQLEWR